MWWGIWHGRHEGKKYNKNQIQMEERTRQLVWDYLVRQCDQDWKINDCTGMEWFVSSWRRCMNNCKAKRDMTLGVEICRYCFLLNKRMMFSGLQQWMGDLKMMNKDLSFFPFWLSTKDCWVDKILKRLFTSALIKF